MRHVSIASALAVLIAAGPAFAGGTCALQGTITPTAPGVPAIVDAAADGAGHLGRMPMVQDPERGVMGPSFIITDVQNGYAFVTDVKPWEGVESVPEGWVSTDDITFVAQTTKGFAAPDGSAAVLWTSTDWIYPDMIAKISGCSGEWAELRLHGQPEPVWVRGTCGNQDTTCDGVSGD